MAGLKATALYKHIGRINLVKLVIPQYQGGRKEVVCCVMQQWGKSSQGRHLVFMAVSVSQEATLTHRAGSNTAPFTDAVRVWNYTLGV